MKIMLGRRFNGAIQHGYNHIPSMNGRSFWGMLGGLIPKVFAFRGKRGKPIQTQKNLQFNKLKVKSVAKNQLEDV